MNHRIVFKLKSDSKIGNKVKLCSANYYKLYVYDGAVVSFYT